MRRRGKGFASKQRVKQVINTYRQELLDKANVVGMAPGKVYTGEERQDHPDYALTVFVRKKVLLGNLNPKDWVPSFLDDIHTDVFQVGDLRAFHRYDPPAMGGDSSGHYLVTAVTLGAVVRCRKTGIKLMLSNNHGYANSNNCELGDPILWPARIDGGQKPRDIIAHLERWEPLQFEGGSTCAIGRGAVRVVNGVLRRLGHESRLLLRAERSNLVDAAAGQPWSQDLLSEQIREVGAPVGTCTFDVDDLVTKRGRTTDITQGRVLFDDAELLVGGFEGGRTAHFTDQYLMSVMGAGGDSGSAICKWADDGLRVGALLFAGSAEITAANRIEHVCRLLDVEIAPPYQEEEWWGNVDEEKLGLERPYVVGRC